MKLAISNIAWNETNDTEMYSMLNNFGFKGIEIAPTRILPQKPYQHLAEIKKFAAELQQKYKLSVPSIQSIWHGRTENIFKSAAERQILLDYTKAAIDFASSVGAKNIVFGCPRNRNVDIAFNLAKTEIEKIAVDFFSELGAYAAAKGTVIGMEANPAIYNTNFINTTAEAIELIKIINSDGFRLNLDVGTMLANNENLSVLKNNVALISHIHISEPWLKAIKPRKIHHELYLLLTKEKYNNFISIEIGRTENLAELEQAIRYVKGVFS